LNRGPTPYRSCFTDLATLAQLRLGINPSYDGRVDYSIYTSRPPKLECNESVGGSYIGGGRVYQLSPDVRKRRSRDPDFRHNCRNVGTTPAIWFFVPPSGIACPADCVSRRPGNHC